MESAAPAITLPAPPGRAIAGSGERSGWRARLARLARLHWQAWACGLVALGPMIFVGLQVTTWARNIPNWDEFDTVFDFLISLDSGATAGEVADELLAVNNEHRMFISRLIFAASYWIWGHVDFAAIALIGNLFIVGVLVFLVARAGEKPARLRLAAILGAAVFQLQHHESFFWGGSSIDHFFVVLASVVALGSLMKPGRGGLALGCTGGVLATFSLAQGLLVWPVGAIVLATARRWRALAVWGATTALTLAWFFADFQTNPGHRLPAPGDFWRVASYWLTMIGSSPALENLTVAPWLGAALVAGTVVLLGRGLGERERLAGAVACWCLGALAMIAWGRALLTEPWVPITSRYIILSSLAWALLGWVLVERALARWGRAAAWTGPLLAGLVLFNFAANRAHLTAGRDFALSRESAVLAFHRHGTFEQAETPIYPDPARADILMREALKRGLFRLSWLEALQERGPGPVPLDGDAVEVDDACYFIDEVVARPPEVRLRGWAFWPEHVSRLGRLSVVFRARDGLRTFKATPQLRRDVAAAYRRPDAAYAGFEVRLPYEQLPGGKVEIGVCYDRSDPPEYMMTSSILEIRQR